MATCQTLLDDLNDRLRDPSNTFASQTRKIDWLNNGIRAAFPKIYRTARDTSLLLVDGQYEYPVPAAVGANSRILRIDVESGVGSGRYAPVSDLDVVPGLTDPILSFSYLPDSPAGSRIRVTAAVPLAELAAPSDVYTGPAGTEELPVLYAMGCALSRRLEDRVDHTRYQSTQIANGVSTGDIMDSAQFWFAQYELLLERKQLPLPSMAG